MEELNHKTPPPPENVPVKKNNRILLWVGIGCLGFFLLSVIALVVIVILVAVGLADIDWDSMFGSKKSRHHYSDDDNVEKVESTPKAEEPDDYDYSEYDWMNTSPETKKDEIDEVVEVVPAHVVPAHVVDEQLVDEQQADFSEAVVEPEPVVEQPTDANPVSIAMVEQKPVFPGGEAAMYKWLSENIAYPSDAAEQNIQGKVIIQFVVEKDGSISNVRVLRGKHPSLDREAVRVVSKMPKWTPGRNNGSVVRVSYMLPITFRQTD